MKKIIYMLLAVFLFAECKAQKAEVVLKQGMVLRGNLISVSPNQNIVLQTTWRDSLLLTWDDVATIDFDWHEISNSKIKSKRELFNFVDSAWFGTLETRLGSGYGTYGSVWNPGIKISAGTYLFENRFLGIAASVAYDGMTQFRSDFVPIGVTLRGHLRTGGLTPFYELGGGYTFAVDNNNFENPLKTNGGAYINPCFGVILKKRPHLATFFKLGYNYTSYGEIYKDAIWQQWIGWTEVEVRKQYDLQSLRLSLGMYFD